MTRLEKMYYKLLRQYYKVSSKIDSLFDKGVMQCKKTDKLFDKKEELEDKLFMLRHQMRVLGN